jgi:hypothetical protein
VKAGGRQSKRTGRGIRRKKMNDVEERKKNRGGRYLWVEEEARACVG